MGDAAKRPNRYAPVAANEYVGRGADVFDVAQAFGLNAPLTMALKYLIRFQRESNPEDAQKARYCLERAEELAENREYAEPCARCGHEQGEHHGGATCMYIRADNRLPCNCRKFIQR